MRLLVRNANTDIFYESMWSSKAPSNKYLKKAVHSIRDVDTHFNRSLSVFALLTNCKEQ